MAFARDTIEFCHVHDGDKWVPAQEPDGWRLADIMAAAKINDTFVPWGGGVVVRSHTGVIVGAIGVSNRTEAEDHELAAMRPPGWII